MLTTITKRALEIKQKKRRCRNAGVRTQVKIQRAYGGCLGTKRRRRTQQAAKSSEETQAVIDPEVSEGGNPRGVTAAYHKLNT